MYILCFCGKERKTDVYKITSQEEDNMNILVCVKQVPDTTQIKIDPVKHTLIREGVPAILNPFDGYAL